MVTAKAAIEKQVLKWPVSRRINFAEKLVASVEGFASSGTEQAWKAEIERRMGEIREGKVTAIPAEEVMAEARRRLNETRRVSSARRSRAN